MAAHAMNVGYRPIAKKGVPALEWARLSHVFQNYFRPETIGPANAPMVTRPDFDRARAGVGRGGLVGSGAGILPNDEPNPGWLYHDGQHRVAAQLDQDVPQTIVQRFELLDAATGLPVTD